MVKSKKGEEVDNLNELEMYEGGTVLANIYETPYIARINLSDGVI